VTETGHLADPPALSSPAARLRRPRVVVALTAAALALAACGQGPGAGDESTAVPTVQQSAAADGSMTAYNMAPIGGQFLDAGNGSIVRARCTSDSCSYELVSTVDGGANWKTATVPGTPVITTPLDDAYAVVLPEGQVVTEIQVSADSRPARHTADGGTVWQSQSAQPAGATYQVRDSETLVAYCAQSVNCSEPVLRVINRNGDSTSFGPPPAQMTETVSATRNADGSLWVQGRDGVGRVLLAISKNNGNSWTVNRVPAPSAATVEIAGNGNAIWALTLTDPDTGTTGGSGGTVPNEPGRRLRQSLLYSNDGGASFVAVKVPDAYRTNTGSGLGVTSGGSAVIAAGGQVVVIAADGTTTPVAAVHGAVYDLGKRVLVYSSSGSWITSDGQSWTELPRA
jgi:hypothetical protein